MTKKSMALAAGILSVTIAGIGWYWISNHQSSAKNSPLGEVCKAGDCISIEKAAEQGDADAQYAVGVAYITGKGVPKDDAAAVKWLGKAAAQGHRDAQFFIAMAYQNGLGGLKADIAESAKLLSKAAAQGHAQAQHILGALYYEGRGVKQDYAESEKLWRLSAEQGIPGSQFNLGALYFEGIGVAKNNNEALKWLIAAAEGGNKQAPDMINKLGYSWPADREKIQERLTTAKDLVKRLVPLSPEELKWRAGEKQKAEALAMKGPDAMDDTGKTALYYAASADDREMVIALLKKGANPNARRDDDLAWAPLHAAACGGFLEIAQLLIDRGAHIDLNAKQVPSPLRLAVTHDQIEVAEMLIARGANPKMQDAQSGWTMLHTVATHSDSREIIELLLRNGVNPNVQERQGRTALHIAASDSEQQQIGGITRLGKIPSPPYGRKAEIVETLLRGGADPKIQDNAKMTPLDYAIAAQSSPDVPASARPKFKEIENLLRETPRPALHKSQ